MRNKPHVLLLSFAFSPNLGGVETHLDDLTGYLVAKEYPVTVVTYQPIASEEKAPSIEKHGLLEIHRLPWIRGLFLIFEARPILQVLYLVTALTIFAAIKIIKSARRIDIIQAHGFTMAISGYILSRIFHIPFTVNTHVSFQLPKKGMYASFLRFILRRAKQVLVLTSDAKKELLALGIEERNITTYHYWVDPVYAPGSQKESRKRLGLGKDRFILLFVGRFIRAKGVDMLLTVAQKTPKNVLFLFAGGGDLLGAVQDQERLGTVRYVGQLSRKELPNYYRSADICVIPSEIREKIYTEGIPRVLIESLSCGTPIIASDAGGLATFLSRDIGFLVKPTVEEVKKTVLSVYKNRRKLASMKKECLKLAQKEFGRERNAQIIEQSLL